jgi:hypothetical protein
MQPSILTIQLRLNMITNKTIMFPVTINYKGAVVNTKGLKIAYAGGRVMYKFALPSSISPVPECWITFYENRWQPALETEIDTVLVNILTRIVSKHE